MKPGDIYEDCAYHPVLCTHIDGDDIEGISLIDGSSPRCCSIKYCAVRPMSLEEAIQVKEYGPSQEKKDHMAALAKTGWIFKKWWTDTDDHENAKESTHQA